MLNKIMLVGRIVSDLQIKETENERKYTIMTLAVPRDYKNENGKYDNDLIPCVLWNNVAVNTYTYCTKDDLVGVKGRIQTRDNKIEVIAENVSFLSNRKAVKNGTN